MTQKKKDVVKIIEALMDELDNEILKALPEDSDESIELRFHVMFRTCPKLKQFIFSLIQD